MPSITVRGVPADVHAELRRRAAAAGRSLNSYLLGLLVDETSERALKGVLDRAGSRRGGRVSLAEATHVLRGERDAAGG